MTGKVKTINLQGKEYAQVADRIKQFREDNPNGLISTEPQFLEDGQIMFTAKVIKDKSKEESAESTGHALGGNKGQKSFEKLETIAIGRALALLGYMASGEIASSEEMEEFYQYKEEKIDEAIGWINDAENIDELKRVFMSLGNLIAEKRVIEAKDKRKEALNEDSTTKPEK